MSTTLTFNTQRCLRPLGGQVRVPGDKSMSHRAVMFSSLANGTSRITGLLQGEDVLATMAAFRAMGVQMHESVDGELVVQGVGIRGLAEPQQDLDMGNSGTAMRLLCGILAAQQFSSKLIGDQSLSNRPMRRVTVPLTSMGAKCVTDEEGRPPIHIRATDKLEPINYKLPVASAQIKSAVLLAGLYADGTTSVTEPAPTRDHTERMLQAFDYKCDVERTDDQQVSTISLQGGGELTAANIDVPADISSAAFFMVAASIVPDSHIVLEHVGINPTRTGVVDVLRLMGADIEFTNQRDVGGEPVADIEVKYVALQGIEIDPSYVPLAIDEFPVLCIAAACAQGDTLVRGAEELRHKESDRISAMVKGLQAIGVHVEEYKDGMKISGGGIAGGVVNSFHDHRIAMSFAIAGAVAQQPVTVLECDNVATSFPNFIELAQQFGLEIQQNDTA